MFPFFLFIVLFVVINVNVVETTYSENDHRLVYYYEKFKKDAELFGKELPEQNFTIWFGNTRNLYNSKRVGYCSFKEPRKIVIDRNWFDNATEEQKELVLYHEFGHCVLNLNHTDDCVVEHKGKCALPVSIMNSSANWTGYFKYKKYYLKELFTNTNYVNFDHNLHECN